MMGGLRSSGRPFRPLAKLKPKSPRRRLQLRTVTTALTRSSRSTRIRAMRHPMPGLRRSLLPLAMSPQLRDGSGDAFLHVSVVERGGHSSVPPGAMLEVRTSPGPKGPQVTEIISMDASTVSQEPPRRPRPERPAYPSGDRAAVEELGTVKWYNANKGFGFIAPDQGGKDIFVHASALERAGIMGLGEGQRVAIDVAQGQKGPEAVGLRLI